MDEEQQEHLAKVNEFFFDEFKNTVRRAAMYLNDNIEDPEVCVHILNRAYEAQIISMFLGLYAHSSDEEVTQSVDRIFDAFYKHAGNVREFNQLVSVVDHLLNRKAE